MQLLKDEKPRLSASKIKSLETCSYLYYLNYHTDFPKGSNDGSSRGSVVHYVLECLIRADRKYIVADILKSGDVFCNKAVEKLCFLHAKKLCVSDPDNISLIKEFIMVALKNDFFCHGALEVLAEHEFNIEGPNWKLKGFIDKIAVREDRVEIFDYKCSRSKKTKEDLAMDYQNLIYTMVVQEKYPELPISLCFQFLKFKREPNQHAPTLTSDQISGFKSYLEYIADYIKDFDEKKALSNLAKGDIKRSWLCGKCVGDKNAAGADAFICSAKYPRSYFVLVDENKKVIASNSLKKELDKQLKEGYNIETRTHPGCPAWKHLWT